MGDDANKGKGKGGRQEAPKDAPSTVEASLSPVERPRQTILTSRAWFVFAAGALTGLGCGSEDAAVLPAPSAPPQQPVGVVEQIEVGTRHACAIMTNGSLRCWGGNTWGQLGTSMWGGYNVPTEIPGIVGVERLHMAGKFSCGIFAGGTVVRCWGDDSEGDLGDGDPGGVQVEPVDVLGIDGIVTKVSSTCALLTDGGVTCWGWGEPIAKRLEFIQDAVDISGYWAITTSGLLIGWHPETREIRETVQLGATLEEMTLGWEGKCVRHAVGTVTCSGKNDQAFLGQGTMDPIDGWVTVPVEASVEIGAGLAHVCSRTKVGGLVCWGDNAYGQMGLGTTGGNQSSPTSIPAIQDAIDVAVGGDFTCVLRNEPRQIRCWGDNDRGQCGTLPIGAIEVLEPTPVAWSE